MTAGDICTRNVVVAAKTEMVVDAAQRMRTTHVGAVVVVESKDGRHVPIGIVTDRDIVVSVVAGDPDHLNFMLIGDMMTTDLVLARADDSIESAVRLMQQHGVRRLPLVDAEGGLVGVLTMDDVLKYLVGEQSLLIGLMARERRQERQHRI